MITLNKQLFIPRQLIIDNHNTIFDNQGMKYREFPGDYNRIREYAVTILEEAPAELREGNLLEQQLSEIIKNGIKHGNLCRPEKKIKIWYDLRNRVRFIVEDEGEGFKELDQWNAFYYQRQKALFDRDLDSFMDLASYRGPRSDDNDGGNSLIAALDYWNGGIIYNKRKNKVAVIRWYSQSSQ